MGFALLIPSCTFPACTFPEIEEAQYGFRCRHSERERFVENRAEGRGARLYACLVLRHANDHGRLLCVDGGGGDEDLAHPARNRRAGSLEPHCCCHRERFRDTEWA